MVSSVKQGWETTPPSTSTGLTFSSLATLGASTSLTSTALDNYASGAANWPEVACNLKAILAGTGALATGVVEIYYKGSIDNATFPDDTNDKLVHVMNANANSGTFNSTFHLAQALGGCIDPYFKLRILNLSGAAFTSASFTFNRSDGTVG